MVLPQAMAWVQYWFRVLSLKFCGKSKKICGDISPQSPAFCMYVEKFAKKHTNITGWKFNKSLVLVEHQLIFSSFYSRGLPPTPPAEGKRENWCSDNFHNLLGRFVIFTISKHLSHSCPRLWRNCWRLAVWDHVCLSALVDHRPDLRFCEIDDTCIYC